MKRLITLFAAIVFVGQAWAEYFVVDNLKYTITDAEKHDVSVGVITNSVGIISDDNKPTGDLVIPAEVENDSVKYTVTSIGTFSFPNCDNLTLVTIPNTVTTIGESAFRSCSGLKSVTIPNSVTSIGDAAFKGCKSLKSVTIGDSVKSIGVYAFGYCSSLKSVTIPNSVTSIGESAFCNVKNIIYSGSAEGSPWEALNINATPDEEGFIYSDAGKTRITAYVGDKKEIVIPNSVTEIGHLAFDGCRDLTSVIIPNSVTEIGVYAFYECSNLTSVTIGNSVILIRDLAFAFCYSLKSVTIPNSVLEMGYNTFNYVKNVVYSGSAEGSPWGALTVNGTPDEDGFLYSDAKKTKLTAYVGDKKEVAIPSSVTSIGEYAFAYCNGLTSVIIPNSVKVIGESAFEGCNGLTSVTIPSSVANIGGGAFSGCTMTIYCEIEREPNGWDEIWNYSECPVVWGYKPDRGRKPTPVLETAANAVNIYAYGRNIVVENATDEICIYDAMGKLICRDSINRVRTEIPVSTTGVYIVKVGNIAKRVVIN